MFLIVLIIFNLNFAYAFEPIAQVGCYLSLSNTTWKLAWQDEFDDIQLNTTEWEVDQDNNITCPDNAYITDGILTLTVNNKIHADREYTGAMITSKKEFSYGRYEIRVALPIGKAIDSSFFTIIPNHFETENQITIFHSGDDRVLYRDFNHNYETDGEQFTLAKNIESFHLYGVEWSKENYRFFFDDIYTEFVYLNDTIKIQSQQKLRLRVNVNKEADKLNFNKLHWHCPALLVDYIRVYEKVNENSLLDTKDMCPNGLHYKRENNALIESICNKTKYNARNIVTSIETIDNCSMDENNCEDVNNESNNNVDDEKASTNFALKYWHFIVIAFLIVIIVFMAGYLIVANNRTNRKLDNIERMKAAELHDYSVIKDNS